MPKAELVREEEPKGESGEPAAQPYPFPLKFKSDHFNK